MKYLFPLAILLSLFQSEMSAQEIYKTQDYKWIGNRFVQGPYTSKANSATDMISNYQSEWNTSAPNYMPDMPTGVDPTHWTLKRDISNLPHYYSSLTIDNALYNMSLEESLLAIEPDSTFRTGVYWGGVWTRDVSYAILHSLAHLNNDVSMRSLLAKVNQNNRIIQDTGTGGAWPCSSDRTTWILAAWECYLVNGSMEWLDRIFPIIRNTIEDDHVVCYDPATQLMRGETSWLDWREQEYPTWMQPADIYMSEAMGTTAVHYRSIRILEEICRIKGLPEWAKKYGKWADDLYEGMNKHLWMDDKGVYAIYLYGRNHLVQHPQMEILGESFAILWDIASAERQQRISQSMISEPFGTPDFYPNLADQFPYHNDAMWPFTQGYWMKAQAKAGNEEGVLHSIASIYRLAAMNLTNLENMVIFNGNDKGIPINSPRQLWSVAAQAAIVPNIYFGISYHTDGIHFAPFVPKKLKANRELSNFKYRDAVLDLRISGFGANIKSFKLDGIECDPHIPADIAGNHLVEIALDNVQPEKKTITICGNAYQPVTPVARLEGNSMVWDKVAEAASYIVICNGKDVASLDAATLSYALPSDGEYSVLAVNAEGYRGYMSEPVLYYNNVQLIDVAKFALPFDPKRAQVKESAGAGGGLAGEAHDRIEIPTLDGVDVSGAQGRIAMITRNENTLINITVDIPQSGVYAIDWRYANGNGPINTDNKCATRLLSVDGAYKGAVVFPHRGTGEWNNWGWSNVNTVSLSEGRHVITLEFCEYVENMNLIVNQALLDVLRISKLR